MTRSLRGRVEKLETRAVRTCQDGDARTVEDLVDWIQATTSEYLDAGFLVETPDGLRLGDVQLTDHQRSVACLLLATYDLVGWSGAGCPRELWGLDCAD